MLWKGKRESGNVEDRRGMSGKGLAIGGGAIGLVILLVNLFLGGGNSEQILQQINAINSETQQELSPEEQAADDERAQFVKVVLAETEDVWHKVLSKEGINYSEPMLVLYRNSVESACGNASSSVGPFYCPGDQKLYIDLSFFEELQQKLKVDGDFPMAYVIAHEVGHHIQYLTGVSDKINRLRQQLDEKEFNQYSVKMELQADFYAGIWSHYTAKMKDNLEPGDIEEVVKHAAAKNVTMHFKVDKNLFISIQDDGKGFEVNKDVGNGLKNMKKRIESIGGFFEIVNADGVMVKMSVPFINVAN